MSTTRPTSRLLRRALQANGLFSGLSAALFLAAPGAVSGLVGAVPTGQVRLLGAQLALFAAWLAWVSTREVVSRRQAWAAVVLDLLWVAGSARLLLAPPPSLTSAGAWAVAEVAGIVGFFAALQTLGLLGFGRLEEEPAQGRGRGA